MLLTTLALLALNVYLANTTRTMVFQSKDASLRSKAQLVASSMSGLESLTRDNVGQVIDLLGDLGVSRVVVADRSGRALYDSLTTANAAGHLVLFSEVVEALSGSDVFYSVYRDGALESRACMPVTGRDGPVGAIYLMEYDTGQGAIVAALESNLLRITLVLGALVLLASVAFALAFSRRMRQILQSIQLLREGEYSHKVETRGRDELSILAGEFNKLTDRLRVSEESRRRFVSDASHELKTPLASIKLLSDSILQNQMDPDTVYEFVGDIGNEADRLTRIAQKLLELNRLDDAPREDLVVMEAGPVVEKAVRLLRPMAELRGVTIESQLELGCTVATREDDVYQVAFNLVENGIKYNKEGGSLLVRLRREEDDVILTVEDTGIGIPPEAMAHVFERFYRVDKARSRQAGGSGLGLSIVHDLVARSYGTVSVGAREGGGTCFTVVLPYFGLEDEP